jgi:hypothetical protein
VTEERTNQLKVMLSDAEMAWLKRRAQSLGLGVSDIIRLWIRAEAPTTVTEKKK